MAQDFVVAGLKGTLALIIAIVAAGAGMGLLGVVFNAMLKVPAVMILLSLVGLGIFIIVLGFLLETFL